MKTEHLWHNSNGCEFQYYRCCNHRLVSIPHLRQMVGSSRFEFQQWVDTVEKLDFLPRSQFLRQQAGFKKKALRVFGRKADFSVCGGPSELAMATRGAICPA
jgi:hypothetical protein